MYNYYYCLQVLITLQSSKFKHFKQAIIVTVVLSITMVIKDRDVVTGHVFYYVREMIYHFHHYQLDKHNFTHLCYSKWYVSNIQSTGLSCHLTSLWQTTDCTPRYRSTCIHRDLSCGYCD